MEITGVFEHLIFVTVRIQVEYEDGSNGSGTGFIYHYKHSDGLFYAFIVTNKHVLEGGKSIYLLFNESDGVNPKLGAHVEIKIGDKELGSEGHPNPEVDVAIMPFDTVKTEIEKQGKKVFYRSFSNELCPTDEQIKELSAVETIYFIGYPDGIYDTVNLLPIVRSGITATSIEVDFSGTPVFLIDASVFPGSSGSPVFLMNIGSFVDKRGAMHVASSRRYFLGVVAAVYFKTEENKIVSIPIPTKKEKVVHTREMIDLGQVFKWTCVNETILYVLKKVGK